MKIKKKNDNNNNNNKNITYIKYYKILHYIIKRYNIKVIYYWVFSFIKKIFFFQGI